MRPYLVPGESTMVSHNESHRPGPHRLPSLAAVHTGQRSADAGHPGGCVGAKSAAAATQVISPWRFFFADIGSEMRASVLAFMTKHATTPNTISAHLLSQPRLLSTTEVIDLLGVTRHTLCAWARASKIPAVRLPDNSYAFDPGALASWIEGRTTQAN